MLSTKQWKKQVKVTSIISINSIILTEVEI